MEYISEAEEIDSCDATNLIGSLATLGARSQFCKQEIKQAGRVGKHIPLTVGFSRRQPLSESSMTTKSSSESAAFLDFFELRGHGFCFFSLFDSFFKV